MKRQNKKPFYIIEGEALDQDVIMRQRSRIEAYVREDLRKRFRKTNVVWNANDKGTYDFRIEFYG
jgi:hypothetical protein